MIKKGDKVRLKRRGEEGIAICNELDGNVMVKVKGTIQNWSIHDIVEENPPNRDEATSLKD